MPPRGSLPRGVEEAVPLAGVPACKRPEGDLQKFLLVGVEGIQLSLGTLQRVLKIAGAGRLHFAGAAQQRLGKAGLCCWHALLATSPSFPSYRKTLFLSHLPKALRLGRGVRKCRRMLSSIFSGRAEAGGCCGRDHTGFAQEGLAGTWGACGHPSGHTLQVGTVGRRPRSSGQRGSIRKKKTAPATAAR